MDSQPWYKKLHWQVAVGLLLGIALSIALRAMYLVPPSHPGYEAAVTTLDQIRWPFAFVGDLFLRLLKLIVLPLIIVSVIGGIQGIGSPKNLGRIGSRTLIYYIGTTLVSVVIGIVAVNIIQPGVGLNLTVAEEPTLRPKPIVEVFRDIIPTNFFDALANGQMLPTIFVSIMFGLALLMSGEQGKPVARVVDALNVVVFRLVDWVMATSPIGVAALLVATLLDPKLADLAEFFTNLGSYMLTVMGGLVFHGFVVLPLVLYLVARRDPIAYIRALMPALVTAFSTASSSATFPLTRDCTIDRAGVRRQSADFVLPVGATINMDGTALYEAVAAVFIANALGIDLTLADQVIIVFTATLAAIGAAGVPSAGLVTMIIVLESVGLPAGGYVLVVAVDRILDMCRTTINVWGDSVGAAVVDRWVEKSSGT